MSCVDQFVDLIVNSDNDYQELDKTYLYNRICALVGDDNHQTDDDVKNALIKTAIKNGKIEDNQTDKEILNDQLMDFMTPLPSKVNAKFWNLYQKNPETATNYFYKLSQDNDYIKVKAIAKNISYQVKTNYGNLEITINLSKPEKDPKAIALAGKQKQTGYPKCQLCMENEGYLGRLGYPA